MEFLASIYTVENLIAILAISSLLLDIAVWLHVRDDKRHLRRRKV